MTSKKTKKELRAIDDEFDSLVMVNRSKISSADDLPKDFGKISITPEKAEKKDGKKRGD